VHILQTMIPGEFLQQITQTLLQNQFCASKIQVFSEEPVPGSAG